MLRTNRKETSQNCSKNDVRIDSLRDGQLIAYSGVMCLYSNKKSNCWNYDGHYGRYITSRMNKWIN